jgi:hypothetical protein
VPDIKAVKARIAKYGLTTTRDTRTVKVET